MNYDVIGQGYNRFRVPDSRIAAHLHQALGPARTVVNVGAGTGAYEPTDRRVVAVEPSAFMLAQRRDSSIELVQASAESLPFSDGAFDAAMAILTIHHWSDWRRGVEEMRRVARRTVLLTWDPADEGFWLTKDYFPELLRVDKRIFPTLAAIQEALPGAVAKAVPIPADCTDGFLGAYWRRPHAYLSDDARAAISSFGRLGDIGVGLQRLAADLEDGSWHDRYGYLAESDSLDLGYRLVVWGGDASSVVPKPSAGM